MLGGECTLRDVVRSWCIFFFFSFYLRYITSFILVLWSFWHTLYLYSLYIDVCMFFTYPYMCCFFSFFIHMILISCMQSIILFHTKMTWWVLFNVFQKYRLSKSTCHKLSSCKVFQEFMLGYILLYSTSEYKLSDL